MIEDGDDDDAGDGWDDSYVTCPHCGETMLEDAEYCPYCDRWMTNESTKKLPWWVVVVVLLLIATMIISVIPW